MGKNHMIENHNYYFYNYIYTKFKIHELIIPKIIKNGIYKIKPMPMETKKLSAPVSVLHTKNTFSINSIFNNAINMPKNIREMIYKKNHSLFLFILKISSLISKSKKSL